MKHLILLFLLLLSPLRYSAARAQSSADIRHYIASYTRIALEQEKKYGIPASIILAQGILESGAGTSELTRQSNNHFGIKSGKNWRGPSYYAWDDEPHKSAFRCYRSAEESYEDHSLLLKNSNRYRMLFSCNPYDYRSWAWGLQHAGYASAGNYAEALIGYIDAYALYAVNGGVKLRPGRPVVEIRSSDDRQPILDPRCRMSDSVQTDEERSVLKIMKRYIVEINDTRCTVLRPGETLASVSQKYNIPRHRLLSYNELSSEAGVKAGDIVYLGPKKSRYRGAQDFYKVKEGDTLYGISQMFGIKLDRLSKMNDIHLFAVLRPGTNIRLK